MNYSQASKALDVIASDCEQRVTVLLDSIRRELVIPFCERKGMKFSAGMGSWDFHTKDHRKVMSPIERNGLPFIIFNTLRLEYPLNPTVQDIGSMMQGYTPRAWIPVENLQFHRLPSDMCGNPRYVIDYTNLLTQAEWDEPWAEGQRFVHYSIAVKRANEIGGFRYDRKSYRGGIGFQSYSTRSTADDIERVTGRRFNVIG